MSRPSISTRTGDSGTTGMFGGGRVSKGDARLHAYGTVDELNSLLGVLLAEPGIVPPVTDDIADVQSALFSVGADLATPHESTMPIDRLPETAVQQIEERALYLEQSLSSLQHFILPGGSRPGALLHQARTVCRRAERWTVVLSDSTEVNTHVIVYLNRLSDYLFLAARYMNKALEAPETQWVSTPKTEEAPTPSAPKNS